MWIVLAILGAGVLGLGGLGAWLLTLPARREPAAAPAPIDAAEAAGLCAALTPRRPGRPLIAVIGINAATETTDYLMPTGILRRADVADVELLATGPGRVRLFPALAVLPDATIGDFDARHPGGADYVLVPAMSRDDDPVALSWIRRQAAKGATVIGVCAGAKVVAAAGLLDGRRATTHWYSVRTLRRRYPAIRYVPDRRIVADGPVVTTTGITASMPLALTLVAAIAGPARAGAVAAGIGVAGWDARHDSSRFALTRSFAWTVLCNRLAFWRQERVGLALEPGMDEVSLALIADAWSRTYRSRALTIGRGITTTANGVRLVPDRQPDTRPPGHRLAGAPSQPGATLDRTLGEIGRRYGVETARVVALQLEYPGPPDPTALADT